ncbi:MAG: ABC transporter permease, partial [Acidobacteria bacterium]|nr:ABC transporter permease [Acidobacteriota bacterium]
MIAAHRLPRRLIAGATGLLAICCAIILGPHFLGPGPPSDPAHSALAPPGTMLRVLELDDGRTLVSPSVTAEGDLLIVDGPYSREEIPEALVFSSRMVRSWLGTDRYGRDILRLMLVGGRLSLMIAGLGALVSLIVGLAVGMGAATGGRWIDTLLMRGVDALMAFPTLLLLILCAAVLDPGPATLVVLLGLTSWMGLARLVRGQVLSVRERQFVMAARVAGTPWYRVWSWHFLPEIRGPVAQDVALRLGDLVLAEATLSYLGLGLPPTTPTWGLLVSEGHRVMMDAWWPATIPGLAIAFLVICFALIGDGIQE